MKLAQIQDGKLTIIKLLYTVSQADYYLGKFSDLFEEGRLVIVVDESMFRALSAIPKFKKKYLKVRHD